MIQVSRLCKSYGGQVVFDEAGFSLADGERLGIVGRNGEGKTTLFRLLLGLEEPDGGEILIPQGYRLGYLSQHVQFTAKTTLEEGCLSLPPTEEGWQESYKVETILHGLGFSPEMMQMPPAKLSGGYQVRLMLGKVLVSEPNLLLLDEPTNYLDIVSIRWLKTFLRAFKHDLMIITHDREFMDEVTTHTLGIYHNKTRKVAGGTGKYYEQILQEEEIHEQTRLNEERKREKIERFINRFRAQATRARAVQSRVRALEKRQKIEQLEKPPELEFRFNAAPFPAKWLMHVRDLTFGFDDEAPLIDGLSFSVGKRDRIAVIGPNGKGKTTLLNLLAGEFKADGGTIETHELMQCGYFGQTNINRLNLQSTIEEEILAVDPLKSKGAARNIAGAMMFEGDAALKRIRVLSGGERSRVLLGKLLMSPANLLMLDEPTNHLDMTSVDSLIEALDDFPGAVILVTHSDMMLHALAERLIVFDGGQVQLFEGSYQDFLERVGWQEEREANQPPSGARDAEESPNKRELRRKRAEIITKRSRELAPHQRRIERLEERVTELEGQLKRDNSELLMAAEKGDGEEIQRLSKSIHEADQEIERLFHDLADTSRRLDGKSKEFEAALEELGKG